MGVLKKRSAYSLIRFVVFFRFSRLGTFPAPGLVPFQNLQWNLDPFQDSKAEHPVIVQFLHWISFISYSSCFLNSRALFFLNLMSCSSPPLGGCSFYSKSYGCSLVLIRCSFSETHQSRELLRLKGCLFLRHRSFRQIVIFFCPTGCLFKSLVPSAVGCCVCTLWIQLTFWQQRFNILIRDYVPDIPWWRNLNFVKVKGEAWLCFRLSIELSFLPQPQINYSNLG
jgi:hypothetical protein